MTITDVMDKCPHVAISSIGDIAFCGVQQTWYNDFKKFSGDDCIAVPKGANSFVDSLYQRFSNVRVPVQVYLCARKGSPYYVYEKEHWYLITDIYAKQIFGLVRYLKTAVSRTAWFRQPSYPMPRGVYFGTLSVSDTSKDEYRYFRCLMYETDYKAEYRSVLVDEMWDAYKSMSLKYRINEEGELVAYS